jgi:GTP-sensing pleiotropic transcriptional regulator CodY
MNEGYTEILTNFMVGDVEDNFYTDEIIIVNLISKVIGSDVLFNAYFNNDTESVLRAMIEAEVK